MSEERIKKILSLLEKAYPDARLVLHCKNPLELLVATILAAQCTDERVNKVTETVFKNTSWQKITPMQNKRSSRKKYAPQVFIKIRQRTLLPAIKSLSKGLEEMCLI